MINVNCAWLCDRASDQHQCAEVKERCCSYWDWKIERQSCEVILGKMVTITKSTVRLAGDKNPEQGR